jgi:light-regulated signal transduction histidine kinase (bacteriophytochrome)
MGLPEARVDYDRLKSAVLRLINMLVDYCAVYQRGSVSVGSLSENDMIHLIFGIEGISFSGEKFEQINRLFALNSVNGLELSDYDPDLVVTKGIIDLHGGQIRIESKSGKSSRFVISLPVYDPAFEYDQS